MWKSDYFERKTWESAGNSHGLISNTFVTGARALWEIALLSFFLMIISALISLTFDQALSTS